MEIVQLMAKAALTLFFVPYIFMLFCRAVDFEPPYEIKSVSVASLIIGMKMGVITIICWLWLI